MTIATCKFKVEDTKSQICFWEMVNGVMEKKGFLPPEFHGFMADEAQANWRAICTIYNGGPDNVLKGKERSCIFHWEQGLQQVTNQYIKKDSREMHLTMCKKWKNAPTKDTAKELSRIIMNWWRNGHAFPLDIPYLDQWLIWWEERMSHWGNFMVHVSD